MKSRTIQIAAVQAVLALGLLQAAPSWADSPGYISPGYISPGTPSLASLWAWLLH